MREQLKTFTDCLVALGYAEFLSSLSPIRRTAEVWLRLRKLVNEQEKKLVDLLLLGRSIPEEELPTELLESIRPLCDMGLFRIREGMVCTSGFSLNLVQGLWLFHELPNPRISLYFGDDSMALLCHQLPIPGGSCLDLCSGPGIQGLYAARCGESVTTVEINPVATDLCKVNALMNGLYERMDIRKGNLYAPIGKEERFDRIIANPPFIPFPKELPYTIIGHGGDDGFAVTAPILDGCAAHLKNGGYGQVLGLAPGNGKEPLCLPLLEDIATRNSVDIRFTAVAHLPLTDQGGILRGIAATSAAYFGGRQEAVEGVLADCYKRQGATELLSYYILLRHGNGKVSVCDLGNKYNNLWYVQ